MSQSLNLSYLTKQIEKPKATAVKLGGYEFVYARQVGYYPYFTITLYNRIKQKKASNIIVVGEGGIGKTYLGFDMCRVLSPKHFNIQGVVFTYDEFMRYINTSRMGVPVCFDEPSYAMSSKDWYNQMNKALVKTIESFRFKVHPLFIPVINKKLLDKTVRDYLIQFQIVMHDRGKGTAYRLYPSQSSEKVYRYGICKIRYDLFDNNICERDTCLDCPKLMPRMKNQCMIFRAQYERKKSTTQQERYDRGIDEAENAEVSKMTDDEVEIRLMEHFDKFFNYDKLAIDVELLQVVHKRELRASLGFNKARYFRKLIEYDYRDKIEALRDKKDFEDELARAIEG